MIKELATLAALSLAWLPVNDNGAVKNTDWEPCVYPKCSKALEQIEKEIKEKDPREFYHLTTLN